MGDEQQLRAQKRKVTVAVGRSSPMRVIIRRDGSRVQSVISDSSRKGAHCS